jgi:hypothetical protein
MPLVFVHGVNVRYDPSDDPDVNARTAMFRDFVLPRLSSAHRTTSIFNPYRGDRAAKFPWNHGALPIGSYEAFGEGDDSRRRVRQRVAESVIGLFKTEVIRLKGPWRHLEAVEFATLEWVDWFNHRRLLEPLGDMPPAEYEARYDEQAAVA